MHYNMSTVKDAPPPQAEVEAAKFSPTLTGNKTSPSLSPAEVAYKMPTVKDAPKPPQAQLKNRDEVKLTAHGQNVMDSDPNLSPDVNATYIVADWNAKGYFHLKDSLNKGTKWYYYNYEGYSGTLDDVYVPGQGLYTSSSKEDDYVKENELVTLTPQGEHRMKQDTKLTGSPQKEYEVRKVKKYIKDGIYYNFGWFSLYDGATEGSQWYYYNAPGYRNDVIRSK